MKYVHFYIATLVLVGSICIYAFYIYLIYFFATSVSAPSRERVPPSKEEVAEKAREVKPILEAIYHFKNEWGVWPLDFEELDMPGKTKIDFLALKYKRDTDGWKFTSYRLFPTVMIYYCYKERTGWASYNGEFEVDIEGFQPEIKAKPLSKDKLIEKLRILSKKRLRTHPDEFATYQHMACEFYKLKAYEEASQLCQIAQKRWPNYWWPNMALALSLQRQGKIENGIKILEAYCKQNQTFTSYYLVHFLYCENREPIKGLKIVQSGLKYPFEGLNSMYRETGQRFGINAEFFPRNAAWCAYKSGKYSLAISICEKYHEFARKTFRGEAPSLHAFCAASCLAQSQFDQARRFLAKAKIVSRDDLLNEEFRALKRAILANNRQFLYESKDLCGEFEVFKSYQ